MGFYVELLPVDGSAWTKREAALAICKGKLEPHPEYEEDFLVPDGVLTLSQDKEEKTHWRIIVRLGFSHDRHGQMQRLRGVAWLMGARLECDEVPP